MHDELDFDPDELAAGRSPNHSAALPAWTVSILALLGLVVGAYLTSVSFSQSGLPLGFVPIPRSLWVELLPPHRL